MIRSNRNIARNGHRGCTCCVPRESAKIIRKREKNTWKKEIKNDNWRCYTRFMSYSSTHKKIKSHRGPASQFQCSICDSPAEVWACVKNKTASGESNGRMVKYSENIFDYSPTCRSCNGRLDNPPQEKCDKGHNDWYTWKNQRRCRPCFLEWQKERRRAGLRWRQKKWKHMH